MTLFSSNLPFGNDKKIKFKFLPHQSDTKLSDALNSTYSGYMEDISRLFEDDNLKSTPDLLKTLRHVISKELIGNDASKTAIPLLTIPPIINDAILMIEEEDDEIMRFKDTILRECLTLTTMKTIVIWINMNHIHYDYTLHSLDVLNWDHFARDDTPVATPSPKSQTVDPTVWATAFATAMNNLPSSTPIGSTPPAVTAPTPAPPAYFIPSKSTPSDVSDRWKAFNKGDLITGQLTRTPYKSGYFHHDDIDHIYLANGQVFICSTIPNEKALMRVEYYCTNNSKAGICAWYKGLTNILMEHGFYCHPIWNFRNDHSGERGFTCGINTTDGLPLRFITHVEQMKGPIARFLSKSKMFPIDSSIPSYVTGANGDGYKALCSILQEAHPIFHDSPALYVSRYPRQGKLSLQEYYNVARDHQQLKAYILDQKSDMDSKHEVDIFIRYSTYGKYLGGATREERSQPALAHKYKGSQLIPTLLKKLTALDSPALDDNDPPRSYEGDPTPIATRKQGSALKVNPVNYVTDYEDTGTVNYESEFTLEPDSDEEDLANDLRTIDIPEDKDSALIFARYEQCVHAIQANTKRAFTSSCIVCGETHTFADCPVLKNADFLRRHYIGFCQQLKRDKATMDKMAGNSGKPGPRKSDRKSDRYKPKKDVKLRFVDVGQLRILSWAVFKLGNTLPVPFNNQVEC